MSDERGADGRGIMRLVRSSPAEEPMPETPRLFVPESPGQYVVESPDGALHLVPDRFRGWRHRQPYRGSAEGLQPVPEPPARAIAVRLGVLPRSAAPIARDPPAPAPAGNGRAAAPAGTLPGPAAGGAPARAPRGAGRAAGAVEQPLIEAVQALTVAVTAQRDRLEEVAARVARLEALRAGDREALRQVGAIDRELQALREQLGKTTDRWTLQLGEVDLELRQLRGDRPRGRRRGSSPVRAGASSAGRGED